jgi:uncharacterized protein YdhG (YjbR/CyaY superfamily)
MKIQASTPAAYLENIPDERKEAINKLRNEVLKNLPKGFEECINYGMLGYVVPHSIFPQGYRCDPKLPLPFANIGSQKNYIAFHHMGLYANPKLLEWFVKEYPKHTDAKLDMGKGCIRFKNPDKIPYKLMGELMSKVTVDEWIKLAAAAFSKTTSAAKKI